jgi:large subunit ribosomal protein L15
LKLNELKISKSMTSKATKRRGQGPASGQGGTAGKGHKGQKARAGKKIRLSFEGGQMPLIRRVPKRGFFNIFRTEYEVVNIDDILRKELTGDITPEVLKNAGLIHKTERVKVLGNGEITQAMTIRAHRFSKSAREKIEKAGGSVEEL